MQGRPFVQCTGPSMQQEVNRLVSSDTSSRAN